jgi:restriction system protein
MKKELLPKFDDLIDPTLQALKLLGGSASIDELAREIVKLLNIPQELAEIPHQGNTGRTELEYRSAWARSFLKKAGFIENSERGVWALTPKGKEAESVDGRQIARDVFRQMKAARKATKSSDVAVDTEDEDSEIRWQDRLLDIVQKMEPSAFERLGQRVLRESGFIEVEVTGRSGDGGIDGYGTIRIGGLISFNVLFQSKRYKSNIGADIVRSFRGDGWQVRQRPDHQHRWLYA